MRPALWWPWAVCQPTEDSRSSEVRPGGSELVALDWGLAGLNAGQDRVGHWPTPSRVGLADPMWQSTLPIRAVGHLATSLGKHSLLCDGGKGGPRSCGLILQPVGSPWRRTFVPGPDRVCTHLFPLPDLILGVGRGCHFLQSSGTHVGLVVVSQDAGSGLGGAGAQHQPGGQAPGGATGRVVGQGGRGSPISETLCLEGHGPDSGSLAFCLGPGVERREAGIVRDRG